MTDFVLSLWRDAASQWRDLRERIGFWQPAVGLPAWMAPAAALAGVIALALAAGIALASIAALLTALLVAHLVLTQLVGISLTVVVPRP